MGSWFSVCFYQSVKHVLFSWDLVVAFDLAIWIEIEKQNGPLIQIHEAVSTILSRAEESKFLRMLEENKNFFKELFKSIKMDLLK